MRGIIGIALSRRIREPAQVVKGKSKPQLPFSSLNQRETKKWSLTIPSAGFPSPDALKARETASPRLPITNMSSSSRISGVTSPYPAKLPDEEAPDENCW